MCSVPMSNEHKFKRELTVSRELKDYPSLGELLHLSSSPAGIYNTCFEMLQLQNLRSNNVRNEGYFE